MQICVKNANEDQKYKKVFKKKIDLITVGFIT